MGTWEKWNIKWIIKETYNDKNPLINVSRNGVQKTHDRASIKINILKPQN